jgi:hypothetical protein
LSLQKFKFYAEHDFTKGAYTISKWQIIVASLPPLRNHPYAYKHWLCASNLNPHNRLLHELNTFGFSDSYVNWFRIFLPKRQFLLLITGIPKSCLEDYSDVVQGNVFGPFLLNTVSYEASLSRKFILTSLMTIFMLLNYQMTVLCNVIWYWSHTRSLHWLIHETEDW